MRERWLPIGVLALLLFGINAAARFVVWLAASDQWEDQILIGLLTAAASGLLSIGAGFRWARRYPVPRATFELGAAILAGSLLVVLVGPFAGGSTPFVEGAALFVRQLFLVIGITAFGALLGVLITMTLGRDWKSQAWKRREQYFRRKPHRTARG